MSDNPEALGLEQRCIQPGHWFIEGRHVVRSNDWLIYDIGTEPTNAEPVHMARRLTEAREWIKEQP